MCDGDVYKARRLYLLNWSLLALFALLLVVCLAGSTFSIPVDGHLLAQIGATAGLAVTAHYGFSIGWVRTSYILGLIAFFIWLSVLATDLSFIAAAWNLPLQDRYFARIDQMLGLDWEGYLACVYGHPSLIPYLDYGYNNLITWPAYVVPVTLSLTGQHVRLQEFVLATILTLMIIVMVSAVMPAMGTYFQYGIAPDFSKLNPSGYVAQIDLLPFVRDGSLRTLNPASTGGIIAFPSLHAAIPILSVWALWIFRWVRLLLLILCADILLATPVFGGHYFVDVFAGIIVAAASICAARGVSQLSFRSVKDPSSLDVSLAV